MLGPGTYRQKDQDKINVEAYRNHTHTHPAKFVFALLTSHVTGDTVSLEMLRKNRKTYLQPPFFSIVL